ncbi:hypothetical protein GCM10023350_10960 [Nocardioides endophyticus]|uniref:Uncharacterized protein n=1 Tax=Nocardioides endophyticus TaxID=1353775 RepID=A0ABP8YHZ0_9ACTN
MRSRHRCRLHIVRKKITLASASERRRDPRSKPPTPAIASRYCPVVSADEKQIRLRYTGTRRICGTSLEARTEAIYERSTKTVRCLDHSPRGPGG